MAHDWLPLYCSFLSSTGLLSLAGDGHMTFLVPGWPNDPRAGPTERYVQGSYEWMYMYSLHSSIRPTALISVVQFDAVTPSDAALMAGTRGHKAVIESHMQFVSLWLYGFPDVNNLSSSKWCCKYCTYRSDSALTNIKLVWLQLHIYYYPVNHNIATMYRCLQ